jgi:AraC-like DNA-binding protein
VKDAGILIRLMNLAMISMGVDVKAVYKLCGITQAHLNDAQLRTPHEGNLVFWQAVEEVTQDPHIGLHLGEHMPVFKGQVLEYLFLSSSTFGEGLGRALRYQRLLTDAASASLEFDVENNMACLVADTSDSLVRSIRQYNECSVISLIKFFGYVTGYDFKPSAVQLVSALPTAKNEAQHQANLDEYQRVFSCPVSFEQSSNRIYFDLSILNRNSLHAEPTLLKLHEQLAGKYVAKLEQQDMVTKVNKIIGELLETGEICIELIAGRLDIKPRALRSQLTKAGTHFNQLLSDYRCHLAKGLLANTDESIDEIVYLTGFSEPSTFYRAFKRWTDTTPVEYRKAKKNLLK